MSKIEKEKPKKDRPEPVIVEGSEVSYDESRLPPVFGKLAAERQRVKEQEKAAVDRGKALTAQLGDMMRKAGIKKVTGLDGFQIYRAKGTNTSISKEKLLANKVTVEQIAASTVVKEYEYVQMVKDGKEAEE